MGPGKEEDAEKNLAHNLVSLVPTLTSNKKAKMPEATETCPEMSQTDAGDKMEVSV